jgi:hypothetical protein
MPRTLRTPGTHRTCSRALAAGALLLLGVRPAAAQRRQVTIDLRPIAGAVAYAWPVAPGRLLGVEAGFGFPQVEQTLTPRGEGFGDFEEYLHLAMFLRLVRSERVEGDVGLRASVADVTTCQTSDCLPGLFGGAYASAFYGRRRVKVGAMVMAGRATEPGGRGATVVNVSPLVLRVKF